MKRILIAATTVVVIVSSNFAIWFLKASSAMRVPEVSQLSPYHTKQSVLVADQPFEGCCVQEPDVHFENGLYRMWYTAGWDHPVIAYAESADGVRWTKFGPVLDYGTGAAHFSVFIHEGVVYLYFSSIEMPGAKLYVATSRDGLHFSEPQLILTPGDWDVALANTAVWVEGNDWYMIYESRTANEGPWRMALAIGSDAYTWHKVARLEGTDFGGSAGGPWISKSGNVYTLTYHASPSSEQATLPTDIFRATSSDLIHWRRVDDKPILTRTQPQEVDQVADPSIANGRLYYSAQDNVAPHGTIMMAH